MIVNPRVTLSSFLVMLVMFVPEIVIHTLCITTVKLLERAGTFSNLVRTVLIFCTTGTPPALKRHHRVNLVLSFWSPVSPLHLHHSFFFFSAAAEDKLTSCSKSNASPAHIKMASERDEHLNTLPGSRYR